MNLVKIKLLVVDDSFLMRKILIELLKTEDYIEVVGEASNGFKAILEIKKNKPDVVTLDYSMPEMDGLETIKKLKKEVDFLPAIIMVSALTSKDTEITLECLKEGAIDFVPKPSGELSIDIKKVKRELIEKIKIAANFRTTEKAPIKNLKTEKEVGHKNTIKVVVVGASTGGPPVVEEILTAIPENIEATILVVQHMPEQFTKSLAKRINNLSKLEVHEAEEGEKINGKKCLIAPGGKHLIVKRNSSDDVVAHLSDKPLRNGFRPSIDYTMESVAQVFKDQAMGIVLTGMGRDGTDGIVEIKNNNGVTIVQDPALSVIGSMPQTALNTDKVDQSLSVSGIINTIIKLTK